jgi:hypothetical protein
MKLQLNQFRNTPDISLSQRFNKFNLHCSLVVFLLIGYLIAYGYWPYREISLSSDFIESYKDVGYWIKASNDLNNNQNPYTGELYRSGTLSASILGLIHFVPAPLTVTLLLFNFFSLLGLIAFIHIVFPNSKTKIALILFMMLFSSTREIFVNGQLTGILLGVFAACSYVLKLSHEKSLRMNCVLICFTKILTGLSLIFVLDAKVNVFLFPVLFIIMRYKGYRFLLLGIILWTLHQVFYSVKIGNFLLLSWYENLRWTSNYEVHSNLYGSLGFWQIINNFFQIKFLFDFGPPITFLIFGLLSLRYARSGSFILPLCLSFLTNYFYSYFHYYSFFPILVLILYLVILYNSPFLLGFIISSMVISFNLSTFNLLISIVIMVLLITLYTFKSIKGDLLFIFGWCLSLLARLIFLEDLDLNDYFERSIIVFIPILALVILYLRSRIRAWMQGVSN